MEVHCTPIFVSFVKNDVTTETSLIDTKKEPEG